MDELRAIVSENLSSLRKAKHLTQQELADRIGYSDKSVSKWELGKAIPTVDILKQFADFYGVTVDFLITAQSAQQRDKALKGDQKTNNNRIIIIAMVATFVWFTAACVYASSILNGLGNWWSAFVWAIPASILTTGFLIFWFWGGKRLISIFAQAFLFGPSLRPFASNWLSIHPISSFGTSTLWVSLCKSELFFCGAGKNKERISALHYLSPSLD